MKRLIIIFFACFLTLLILFSIRPTIKVIVKKQLEGIFIDGRVSIGNCVFSPTSGVGIFNIGIKKEGAYDIKIKELDIKYDFSSVLKTGFLKLYLNNPVISLNTPKEPINEFAKHLNIGKGKPIFKSIELANASLDLNTSDLIAKINLDSKLSPVAQPIGYLNLRIDHFSMFGVSVAEASLKFGPDSNKGQVNIASLKYDKLIVSDIKGSIKLEDNLLSLHGASAKALNGTLQLDLGLKFDKILLYSLKLNVADLEIEKFVSDFDLVEKFNMTGHLSGALELKGKAAKIEILDGKFSVAPPGGVLVIKDTEYLENMAQASSQPLSLLVENFKDYRYNIGSMGLGAEDSNIVLKINLEGDTGKRELSVVFHDF